MLQASILGMIQCVAVPQVTPLSVSNHVVHWLDRWISLALISAYGCDLPKTSFNREVVRAAGSLRICRSCSANS